MFVTAPNVSQSFFRRSSHIALESQETHYYAPQSINRSYFRRSSHISIEPEHHTLLYLNRTYSAPEYTLQLETAGVKNGRIQLRKNGHVEVDGSLQCLPIPGH